MSYNWSDMSNFKIKATKLPKHTKEFEILAAWEYVLAKRDEAFAELASSVTVPGFRKGAAPANLAARHINPENLYDKTGRKILPDLYKELIDAEKINPVTTPSVELLEAKENEPWKFKVTVAEIPSVKIKDYKKKVSALHEDARAKSSTSENEKSKKLENKKDDSKLAISPEAGIQDDKQESLNVEDKKVRAPLQEIFKTLLEEAEVEVPDLLTREEVSRRLAQIREDVKKVGLTFEQYLESRQLKAEELEAQYQKDAEEMYKLEFVLAEIAKQEGLKVDPSELESILGTAKTDKEKEIAAQNMEWYEGILRKQKVLDFLNDL